MGILTFSTLLYWWEGGRGKGLGRGVEVGVGVVQRIELSVWQRRIGKRCPKERDSLKKKKAECNLIEYFWLQVTELEMKDCSHVTHSEASVSIWTNMITIIIILINALLWCLVEVTLRWEWEGKTRGKGSY